MYIVVFLADEDNVFLFEEDKKGIEKSKPLVFKDVEN